MAVLVHCSNPSCKQEFRIKEEMLGKSGKCKACGTTFVLRAPDAAPGDAREVSISMLKDDAPASAPKPAAAKGPAPTPANAPTPTPSSGTNGSIGRFEVRKRLGAGAFGTVYLAYDPQLQRELAIKVPQRTVLSN